MKYIIFILIFIFTTINLIAADGLFDIYMTRDQVKKDVFSFINSDKGKDIIGQVKGVKAKADIETKTTIEDFKKITKIVQSVPATTDNKQNAVAKPATKKAWWVGTVYEDYYKNK